MVPSVADVKSAALEYLDDPAGSRFTSTIQTWGFEQAYLKLLEYMLLYEVQKQERVATYTLPANTTSLTPATAGISDFGELTRMEERLDGSSERYTQVVECDALPQRDAASILCDFEWRDDTWYFVGSTTARQLRISYLASGTPPTSGSVGIDGSKLVLALLAAAYMAPRKGDPELGRDLMKQALGPRFEEGVCGGSMWLMLAPMVKSRQSVPIAPKAFRAGGQRSFRKRQFYVGPVTNNTVIVEMTFTISGTVNGTNGFDGNATFTLDQSPSHLNFWVDGILQYPNISYVLVGNTVTFQPGWIPQIGSLLYATGSTENITFVAGVNPLTPVPIAVVGTVDGTNGSDGNASFSMGANPTSLQVFKNGLYLIPNVAYTRSGASITFLAPHIPVSGDTLQAWGTV